MSTAAPPPSRSSRRPPTGPEATTFASGADVVVGRSLRQLARHGRLPTTGPSVSSAGGRESDRSRLQLRFVHQRVTHSADLFIEDRLEETPRGVRPAMEVRLVDTDTEAAFACEDEWTAACLLRQQQAQTLTSRGGRAKRAPPKAAFVTWDKIHAWAGDEELGSLNDLRRIAAGDPSAHAAAGGRPAAAGKRGRGAAAGDVAVLGQESDDDDEDDGEGAEDWRSLDDVMRGEEEEATPGCSADDQDEERQRREEAAVEDYYLEVSSEAAVGGRGAAVPVEPGLAGEWSGIDAKEVHVFGRPVLGFGVGVPLPDGGFRSRAMC